LFVLTKSLAKRYRQVTALDDCSLEVTEGEVFGLLGPNGAGKTTLIRLLMGYLRPTSGSASIGGFDCCHQSLHVRRITAYLPGEPQLFRGMRGGDVLDFFARLRPGKDPRDYRRIANRLELDLSRRVAFMSTGMRQKLALAVTLAANTPLTILDEPTSNLDPTVRSEVVSMVHEARRRGRTVVFSSHVLAEVEEACDRVAILRNGRLVHVQAMPDLRRRHRIHAWFREPVADSLAGFAGRMVLVWSGEYEATMETDGELAPLLAWLASLPLADVRVEQVGLRAVYDRYHPLPKSDYFDAVSSL
jgi:ABC-2 type transport system ATP-binding protein